MVFLPQIADRIKTWKASGYELYCVQLSIKGELKPFVIRALTKHEYESLVEGLSAATYFPTELETSYEWPSQFLSIYGTRQYQDILRAGLLWPFLTDDMPAGIDGQLAKQIALISGWSSKGKFLEELQKARNKASTIWGFLESRIRTAFPYFTDEDIKGMTLEALADKAAMSELITGVEIDPRPWVDPEGYLAEQERLKKLAKKMAPKAQLDTSNVRDPRIKDQLRKLQLAQLAEETKVDLTDRSARVDFDSDKRQIAAV
jgi:hypothetical protein